LDVETAIRARRTHKRFQSEPVRREVLEELLELARWAPPTLVVASAKLSGDEHQNHEDVLATACAVYIVLLAANARGLASYWRTPRVLQTPEGRAAIGMGDDEEFVGLIHLGQPVDRPESKGRKAPAEYVEFLK
jgi:nitroreductase